MPGRGRDQAAGAQHEDDAKDHEEQADAAHEFATTQRLYWLRISSGSVFLLCRYWLCAASAPFPSSIPRVAGTGVLGGIIHMYDRQTTSRCSLQGCFL